MILDILPTLKSLILHDDLEHEKEYSCKICNKLYTIQSSLCNHNKKFHSNIVKVVEKPVEKNKSLICESLIQGLQTHIIKKYVNKKIN